MTVRSFAAWCAGVLCGFAAAWLSLWAVEVVWLPRIGGPLLQAGGAWTA